MSYKYSIIVPCYNVSEFILHSFKLWNDLIRNDVQFIFVNDGSSDNTEYLLSLFQGDSKIITTDNLGVSHARNVGLYAADSEYVIFLDSDDYFSGDYLNFLDQSTSNNCDVIITPFKIVDYNSNVLREPSYGIDDTDVLSCFLRKKVRFHLGSLVLSKAFLDKYGTCFPENVHVTEDIICILDVLSNNPSIYYSNEVFFNYLHNVQSVMNSSISIKHFLGIQYLLQSDLSCKENKYFNRFLIDIFLHTIRRGLAQSFDAKIKKSEIVRIVKELSELKSNLSLSVSCLFALSIKIPLFRYAIVRLISK